MKIIQKEKSITKDTQGTPITNSAGETFEPPMTIDYAELQEKEGPSAGGVS